jgi:hypothetical protein
MRSRVVLVALVVLLVGNLAGWVINQVTLPRDPRLERSPRSLREVASASRNPDVRYVFAPCYLLRERIGGATLILTRHEAKLRFELEHIAQLRLELVRPQPYVDPAAAARLDGPRDRFRIQIRGVIHDAELLVEAGARRYVLATIGEGGAPLIILPESRYRAIAGASFTAR